MAETFPGFPDLGGIGKPPAPPTESPVEKIAQMTNSPQARQLLQAIAAIAQQAKAGASGGGGGGGIPASQGPGTVSGLPGVGSGQYPMPTPTPPRQPSNVPGSSEMMSKLAPNSAGVYQGIQGISQLLQNYEQKKDQQQHTQAENIAKNLMSAMDATNSPDEKTRMNALAQVYEILNDKHQKKILDKVYKGWLQQAQKQQGEVDPEQAGFEKGIQDYIKTGKMPQQPLQMPRQMGGVGLPQAGPAQQMQNLTQAAQLRYLQEHPELAGKTPEQTKLETALVEQQTKLQEGAVQLMKAQGEAAKADIEYKIKQTELQIAEKKGGAEAEKARSEADAARQRSITAGLEADAARYKLEYLKLHPPGSPSSKIPSTADLRKPEASDAVVRRLENMVANKQSFTAQDTQWLDTQLRAAGASNLAKNLPQLGITRWWAGPEAVKDLLDSVRDYRDSVSQPIRDKWPDWKFGWDKGTAKSEAAPAKAEATPPSSDTEWTQIQGKVWIPPKSEWPHNAANVAPTKDGKKWFFISEDGDSLGEVPARPVQ